MAVDAQKGTVLPDAKRIASRVETLRKRNSERDKNYLKLLAIRDGDYDKVAPGLFPDDFDKPLIANFIDVSARDIAESMAPLPAVNCQAPGMASEAERKRQDKRQAIANYYVQHSRLEDQMPEGCDRFGSFGVMAYIVEPDFQAKCPFIRISDCVTSHFTVDRRGNTKEYAEVYEVPADQLCLDYPEYEQQIKVAVGHREAEVNLEVAQWYDDEGISLVLLKPEITLVHVPNKISRCPVRLVLRPNITGTTKGQFDDVIWVQVARALVAMYTLNALDRAVNAPLVTPDDVNEVEIGPFSTIQTKQGRNSVGYVDLAVNPALFPENQMLQQEQRVGSRYPEGRSGSIDASIITGQGVQALMGTFDTQVATFQRLNATALEDVISICFEMDQAFWPNVEKTIRVRENGSPVKVTYRPARDIAGEFVADVTYGAIAGLDPNRGLVFILQALAGQLISKDTARRYLPVDINADAEEQRINIEGVRDSLVASIAALPQALPMMVTNGMDPRQIAVQVADVMKRLRKGESIEDIVEEVFAPEEEEQPAPSPLEAATEAAQGGGPAGLPGEGSGGASDMLMMLAGLSGGGSPNLQANVSRMQPM